MYDFDEIIPRRGTGCVKYDWPEVTALGEDAIPLWVADMDFRTPDFVVDALRERLEHPVFGYTMMPQDYFPTISRWVKELHGWTVKPSEMIFVPGIVKGIAVVIKALLKPGEKVIIQPPVYHPFRFTPQRCGCEVVFNPLRELPGGGYEMDFDNLESVIDDSTKLLILANPHNPGGICWSRQTLQRLAEITTRRGVTVISDEIHCEMVLPVPSASDPSVLEFPKHIPYASVSEAAEANSITFMAPSKTFNIAGIVSSYAIVKNPELRERFFGFMNACELEMANIFSITATMAAYRHGKQWRREMLEYVKGNVDFVESFLKEKMPLAADGAPVIRCMRPQASFLVWLDCRALGLPQDALMALFTEKARIFPNDGSLFGSYSDVDGKCPVGHEGDGFMRLNVGCPRSLLKEALERLAAAI